MAANENHTWFDTESLKQAILSHLVYSLGKLPEEAPESSSVGNCLDVHNQEYETSEALIILTGLTADRNKKSHVLNFFKKNTQYQVFLPNLCQYFGIRSAARQLCYFLKRNRLERFNRCHFICYISGGFILRRAVLNNCQLPNLGRVVYVRSPFQERVPALSIHKYGRVPAMLIHGKMLLDLASDWINELPEIQTQTGVVIEQGISELALNLGLKPSDFEIYRNNANFLLPTTQAVLTSPLSHDDVYSNDEFLKQLALFIESGRFRGNCDY